jgi:hypothetical protein
MATSYSNPGGQGDRQSIITVTASFSPSGGTFSNHVDGSTTADSAGSFWASVPDVSGDWIQYAFDVPKIIDEVTWKQNTTTAMGTWKWQRWDGASWVDVGSSFTLGGATTQVQTSLAGNTDASDLWRLAGISGTFQTAPWVQEIEFKLEDEPSESPSESESESEPISEYPSDVEPDCFFTDGDRNSRLTCTTDLPSFEGTASNIIDGAFGNTASDSYGVNVVDFAGLHITFVLDTPQSLQGFRLYLSAATLFGTWQWQSWNGATWDDEGAQFTLGSGTATHDIFRPTASVSNRWRLLGVSGSNAAVPYLQEIELYIDGCNMPSESESESESEPPSEPPSEPSESESESESEPPVLVRPRPPVQVVVIG